ncbi:hypothetical protein [Clostridium diolis]|uniref:hypothetical protein n=1 Tax=Clostridium diolis TaxID=223919 RepID=UPI003AF82ADA
MEEITNPFESLHNTIVFDVKDWSTDKRNAWIYGIIVGWGSDDPEIAEEIFQEFNKQFRWTRETWNRLQILHKEFLRYRKISESVI